LFPSARVIATVMTSTPSTTPITTATHSPGESLEPLGASGIDPASPRPVVGSHYDG
jgi:hypothetical protein